MSRRVSATAATTDHQHSTLDTEPVAADGIEDFACDDDSARTDTTETADDKPKIGHSARRRRISWTRVLALGILPGLALLLAMGAGYLKWVDTSARESQTARVESVKAATDTTIAMLSYKHDTADHDLGAAQERLTGSFKGQYALLIHDVVIPGAKQKQISAVAAVPAAASVSATETHAVVLVFIDQTTTIGQDAPTNMASSVRVSLDNIEGRWLVSGFERL
jgi:Mce-associated membrane protein